jgi:hypothetical protein
VGWIAKGKPMIVFGAGTAGGNLVRELARSSEWRLVGLLDDDPTKRAPKSSATRSWDQRTAALGGATQGRYGDHRDSVGIGGCTAACCHHVCSRWREGAGPARAHRA